MLSCPATGMTSISVTMEALGISEVVDSGLRKSNQAHSGLKFLWGLEFGAFPLRRNREYVSVPRLSNETHNTAALDRARRKAYWRLLPLLFFAYVVAYIDRTNINLVKLTMAKDLPA